MSLKFPFTTKIVVKFQHSVSFYGWYISRKHENFRYWPYKSHDVTIETLTNHISSRRDIVFRSIENDVGIGKQIIISKKGSSFQITLKLRRNHDLNDCARMDISRGGIRLRLVTKTRPESRLDPEGTSPGRTRGYLDSDSHEPSPGTRHFLGG